MKKTDIVFVNGCFDTLHAGHCKFLQFCVDIKRIREAYKLIVALDSDEKIKQDKGAHRPYYSFEERRSMLHEAFPEIDSVIEFDTNKELESHIKRYKPILIKGGRWKGNVVGAEYASEIIYVRDFSLPSTTEIEARIKGKII